MKKVANQKNPPKINVSMPNDVLIDVFTRLPVKSLLRFRCVSKQWCSIICNPFFCDRHLTRFQTSHETKNLIISFTDLFRRDMYFFSINQNSEAPVHLLTVPLTKVIRLKMQNSETINGLFCLSHDDKCTSLFNISTRESIDLPVPSNAVNTCYDANNLICSSNYSFGFDPVTNEYKVLNLLLAKNSQRKIGRVMGAKVFTLGTNSWRRIKPPTNMIYYTKRSVCIDGAIHSIVLSFNGNCVYAAVEAFDIHDEKFRVIDKLPFKSILQTYWDLIQIGGCLAIVTCLDNMLELWILKDYHNKVWIKEAINFSLQGCSLYDFTTCRAVNTDEILLIPKRFSTSSLVIYCYDLKTKASRKIEVSDLPVSAISEGLSKCDIQCNFVSITNCVENIMPLRNSNYRRDL